MLALNIAQVGSHDGAAVVIDVMRAYTVAALALEAGASKIVLVAELEDALRSKDADPGSLAFQDGAPVPGFDLANSPEMLRDLDLAGRNIYQRTTAGTRGALAARRCRPLFCASFASASATARALRSVDDREIAFVITGNDGRAEEDRACAEFIDALVRNPASRPERYLERARQSDSAHRLNSAAAKGYAGVHPADVRRCLDVDAVNFAMRAEIERGDLVLRKVEAGEPIGR